MSSTKCILDNLIQSSNGNVLFSGNYLTTSNLNVSGTLTIGGTSSSTSIFGTPYIEKDPTILTIPYTTTVATPYFVNLSIDAPTETLPSTSNLLVEYYMNTNKDTSGNNNNLNIGSTNQLITDIEKGSILKLISGGTSTIRVSTITSSTTITGSGTGLTLSFDIKLEITSSAHFFSMGNEPSSVWSTLNVDGAPTGIGITLGTGGFWIMFLADNGAAIQYQQWDISSYLNINAWNHIDIVFSAKTLDAILVYANGSSGILRYNIGYNSLTTPLIFAAYPTMNFYGGTYNKSIANFRLWLRELSATELKSYYTNTNTNTLTTLAPQVYTQTTSNLQLRVFDRSLNLINIAKNYNLNVGCVLFQKNALPISTTFSLSNMNFTPYQLFQGNSIYPYLSGLNYTTTTISPTYEAIGVGASIATNPTTTKIASTYGNLYRLPNVACNTTISSYQNSPRFPLALSNSTLSNIGCNFAMSYVFKNPITETTLPQFDTNIALGWSSELESMQYYDIFFGSKQITITKMSLGQNNTIFLGTTTTGQVKVFACGDNGYGQLGDGTNIQRKYPIEITYLSGCNITDISSGGLHTLFVSSNNSRVYACGNNTNGQLGTGNTSAPNIPTLVSALSGCNITSVACGFAHTLFLSSTANMIYSSGSYLDGKLGIGTTTIDATTPKLISELTSCNITKISAGSAHSVFLSATNNKVFATGYNTSGQLGMGNTTTLITPIIIQNLTNCNITDISAGWIHTVFSSLTNNIAYATGNNTYGQLGTGNTTQCNVPSVITTLTGCNITSITTGQYHTAFASSNQIIYSTGLNTSGQLGISTSISSNLFPVVIPSLSGVSVADTSSASSHSGVITSLGTVYLWGANGNGQLGDNTIADKSISQLIPIYEQLPITITQIAVGQYFTLFLAKTYDGVSKVFSVGINNVGQLGLSDTIQRQYPVEITRLTGCNITDISAGYQHSVFLSTTCNRVYSCGYNGWGQLGYNTVVDCNTPTVVSNIYNCNITNISCGTYNTLFVSSSGNRVYGCGWNNDGSLGIGNVTQCNIPTVIPALSGANIIKCSAGNGQALFVSSTNLVYSCGWNVTGSLGLGNNTTPITTATNVQLLTGCDITDVYCGGYDFSYFLSATKNIVYSCGRNDTGQLGLCNTTSNNAPQIVQALLGKGISSISTLWQNALFYSSNNKRVYGVGYNINGEIGNGTNTQYTSPVLIPALNDLNISSLMNNSSRAYHSGVITASGRIAMWGCNQNGQLGLDDTITRYYPVPFPIEGRSYKFMITKVAIGGSHAIILGSNMYGSTKVFCSGCNFNGQLGLGNTNQQLIPVEITAITQCNITDVYAGTDYTIFLSSSCNRIYSCGYNNYGQLGIGNTIQQQTPTEITALRGCNITDVSCGDLHTIFLSRTCNNLYATGWAGEGRLGNGTSNPTMVLTPALITNLTGCNITKITTGDRHTLFLAQTCNLVYGCGYDGNGQIGIGSTVITYTTPFVISAMTSCNITDISAGYWHSIFISSSLNKVFVSGYNTNGQLGMGNTTQYNTPTLNTNISGAVVVVISNPTYYYRFANNLISEGTSNTSLILSSGTITYSSTPFTNISSGNAVLYLSPNITLSTSTTAITISFNFLGYYGNASNIWNVIYIDGVNICKYPGGANAYSLLICNAYYPIPPINIWVVITVVININGATQNVYYNNILQTSTGGSTASPIISLTPTSKIYFTPSIVYLTDIKVGIGITPTVSSVGCNITNVSCGCNYSLFLSSNSKILYSTGINTDGQLGNNTTTQSTTPVVVPRLTNIPMTSFARLSPRSTTSATIIGDGTSYIWGNNTNGQLGQNDLIDKLEPVEYKPVAQTLVTTTCNITVSCNITLTQIETSQYHSLFLGCNASGVVKVYSAGLNTSGQLGDGTATQRQYPVEIITLTGCNITDISAGATHSIFLSSTCNRVYACGNNASGQLGGAFTTCNIPQVISTLTGLNITSIATGSDHTMFFSSSSGKVYMCGSAVYGRLGNSTTTPNITMPFELTAVSTLGISAIAAGSSHSMFLSVANNKVYSCGLNLEGNLCLGDTSNRTTPTEILNLRGSNITSISGGQDHSIFLVGATGTVYTGGYNTNGQLGTGDNVNRYSPYLVTSLNGYNITAISAIGGVSIFMSSITNRVYSTGANDWGQLGIGNLAQTYSPVEITTFRNISIKTLCTGKQGAHTAIVTNDGKGYIWGDNTNGKLGLNDFGTRISPVLQSNITQSINTTTSTTVAQYQNIDGLTFDVFDNNNIKITKVATGALYTIFIGSNSAGLIKVYGVGLNTSGQLGLNDTITRQYPVEITRLTGCNITDVSCGNAHTIFLSTNPPQVYTCGYAAEGSLGNNTTTPNILIPTAIGLSNSNITAISGGSSHSMFLSSSGIVYMCGNNESGRLGNGLIAGSVNIPTALSVFSSVSCNVIGMSAGGGHSMFLLSTRAVYTCGFNANGQLGKGDTATTYTTPQLISSLSSCNITKVEGGRFYSMFFSATCNTVYACGNNDWGQLGTGSTANIVNTAQYISLLQGCNISDIRAGAFHSQFYSSLNNILYTTGYNVEGQLGLGDTSQRTSPTVVKGLTNVPIASLTDMSTADSRHNAIITKEGKVFMWGRNDNYQLGLEDTTQRNYPELRTITEFSGSSPSTTTMSINIGTSQGSSITLSVSNYPYTINQIHTLDVAINNNVIKCYLDGWASTTATLPQQVDISTNPNIRVYQRLGKVSQQFGQVRVWNTALGSNDFYRANNGITYYQ